MEAYNLQDNGITADNIQAWLGQADKSWYATGYSGGTEYNPRGDGDGLPASITGNDDGSVDITNFVVRTAANGSSFGTKISLDDSSYGDYSGLTFSVTLDSVGDNDVTLTVYLAYEISDG